MNNRGRIAIFQIFILIVGIIAIGWSIGEVSGAEGDESAYLDDYDEAYPKQAAIDKLQEPDVPNAYFDDFNQASPEQIARDARIKAVNDALYKKQADAAQAAKAVKRPTSALSTPAKGPTQAELAGFEKATFGGTKIPSTKKIGAGWFTGKSTTKTFGAGNILANGEIINSGSFTAGGKTFTVPTDGSIKVIRSSADGWTAQITDAKGKITTEKLTGDPTAGIDTKNVQSGSWYGAGTLAGSLVTGLAWAGTVGAITGIVAMFAPDSWKPVTSALFPALSVGAGVAGTLWSAGAADGFLGSSSTGGANWWGRGDVLGATHGQAIGVGVGLVAAAAMFYMMYSDTEQEIITFTCYPWDAPTGGARCEECNDMSLPCSEYQCKSLGQACELLNPGTDEAKCSWNDRHDAKYPIITPLESALTKDHKYTPDGVVNPPDRGVIIINLKNDEGKVKAFTPLSFGIQTDEPAKCKLDYTRKKSFDDMSFYFGGSSTFKYNHTQVMSLPHPDISSSENLTIKNNGKYTLYARCQDANGNHNEGNFVINFAVDDSPDTTAPLIVATSLIDEMPVSYNTTEIDLEVYVNEMAQCRWDTMDREYDKMINDMSCVTKSTEMNAAMVYPCKTTLTGLRSNGAKNQFFFRCRDKPLEDSDRNTNSQSKSLTLIGTEPLVIKSIEPNETIKGSSESIQTLFKVETVAGYKDGDATCYYSETGDAGDYIKFFQTDSYEHETELYLTDGEYEYFIKCVDLGGNTVYQNINFNIESDRTMPAVVRAYRDDAYLKIITNEESECVYDTKDCLFQFDDGIKMSTPEENEHFVDWAIENDFYIKCKDEYNNQPLPSECSIIVKPYELL